MKSIEAFDRSFPVRTVFSDCGDFHKNELWRDNQTRQPIIEDYLGMALKEVRYPAETHSGNILLINSENPDGVLAHVDEKRTLKYKGGFDGIVCSIPGILICLWTADCLPVFLYDPKNHVAAVAHNGWRGVCSGIAVNEIEIMKTNFGTDPRDVIVGFGPCICGNCYEVTEELITEFSERFGEVANSFFTPKSDGKYLLDNKKAVRFDLERIGVKSENIHDVSVCSFENHDYASFRREGLGYGAGQTLSGIVLKQR